MEGKSSNMEKSMIDIQALERPNAGNIMIY
jgi:hypothetical protein